MNRSTVSCLNRALLFVPKRQHLKLELSWQSWYSGTHGYAKIIASCFNRQQREEIESKRKDLQQSKTKCSKSENLRPESPTRVVTKRYVPPRRTLMPYRLPATLQQTVSQLLVL